jgi:hypothetical protein
LVERWNGIDWTIVPLTGAYDRLRAVSCFFARACTAVGGSGIPSSHSGYRATTAFAEHWDGATWRTVPIDAPGRILSAVSCAWANGCIAVGSSGADTFAQGWDGIAWTPQAAIDPPGASSSALSAVSCPSPTVCMAVGSQDGLTLAERYTGQPPVSVSPPSISGTPQEGQTLTSAQGTWANSPTSYGYQWQRCDARVDECASISAATHRTYTLTAEDVGHRMRVQEAAHNPTGIGEPATSQTTTVVQARPAVRPELRSRPRITGTPRVGARLSASSGTWSGTPAPSFSYRWQRCKRSCATIPTATARVYRPRSADMGTELRVRVTASNSAGSAAATSGRVGPIAPTVARLKAHLLKHLAPSGKAARISALLRTRSYTFAFRTLGSGRIRIDWYYLRPGASIKTPDRKPKPVLVAAGAARFAGGTTVKLTIKLASVGRRLLARANSLKITARGTYTPTANHPTTATKRFTLRR